MGLSGTERDCVLEFLQALIRGGPSAFIGSMERVCERRAMLAVKGEIGREEGDMWWRCAVGLGELRRGLTGVRGFGSTSCDSGNEQGERGGGEELG